MIFLDQIIKCQPATWLPRDRYFEDIGAQAIELLQVIPHGLGALRAAGRVFAGQHPFAEQHEVKHACDDQADSNRRYGEQAEGGHLLILGQRLICAGEQIVEQDQRRRANQ